MLFGPSPPVMLCSLAGACARVYGHRGALYHCLIADDGMAFGRERPNATRDARRGSFAWQPRKAEARSGGCSSAS